VTGKVPREQPFHIFVAGVRGACAGVERAIQAVEVSLQRFGAPVFVRKQIVHNSTVVERLARIGAVVVDSVAEVPSGAVVLISAHGAPPAELAEAADRGVRVVDATCPLVTKVHHEIDRYQQHELPVIIVGHRGHDEVTGHLGRSPAAMVVDSVQEVADLPDLPKVAYVTQTTLSVDDTWTITEAIKAKFVDVEEPRGSDICYATQNRQASVRELAEHGCDLIVVVSDTTSSNGNRLVEVGASMGCATAMIADATQVNQALVRGARNVGVTGAASTPLTVIDEVIKALVAIGGDKVTTLAAAPETVVFGLPEELR